MSFVAIKDCIAKAKHALIAAHTNPDGDAIGAMVSMGYLCAALKTPYTILMEKPVEKFTYLTKGVKVATSYEGDYDVFICLDCGDVERLGCYKHYATAAKETICIDHHFTNTQFATYNHVEATASSTSELMYDLIGACQVKITEEMAMAIYTGMVTDTGGFMHSCTNPSTHHAAAALIPLGFDFSKIYHRLMHQHTLATAYLQMEVMKHLEQIGPDKYLSYLLAVDLEKHGATKEDVDGVVHYMKNIAGADLVALLYPTEEGYKLSLRSNPPYDVAEICKRFGGGGHIRAAGATLAYSFEEAYQLVKDVLVMAD